MGYANECPGDRRWTLALGRSSFCSGRGLSVSKEEGEEGEGGEEQRSPQGCSEV